MQLETLQNIISKNRLNKGDEEALAQMQQQYPYFATPNLLLLQNSIANNTIVEDNNARAKAMHVGDIFTFLQKIDVYRKLKNNKEEEILIAPLFTDNYFAHQQVSVTEAEVATFVEQQKVQKEVRQEEIVEDQGVMITRTFEEWLVYFKGVKEHEKKQEASKQNLTAIWQREKLTAAAEEENEIVPENVFKMAIDSISVKEDNVSEPLAQIMASQGKIDRAVEMYKKLSLQNPQKSAYFAAKIKDILKKQ